MKVEEGLHYNKYMPGGKIAMMKPLADGQVEYTDGSPMTVDQYARDVTAFMMWAAEPHLEQRKQLGFRVMVFLIVFAGLLYTRRGMGRRKGQRRRDAALTNRSRHTTKGSLRGAFFV